MNASFLRPLWAVLTNLPAQHLSQLDDASAIQCLLDLLRTSPEFDSGQIPAAKTYMQTRLPLIREMVSQTAAIA